jgi:ELWxxDGT repeat protein
MNKQRHRRTALIASVLVAFAAHASLARVTPTLVKDIAPGTEAGGFDGLFSGFTLHNGALYFAASDDTAGVELWRTDGTTGGTQQVIDLRPGAANGFPQGIRESNGKLYFSGYDTGTGSKAFISDGTAATTSLLVDTDPTATGGFFGPPMPAAFTPFTGGRTLFTAADPTNGQELWITNGTPAGTSRVKDIHPGEQSSIPVGITVYNGVAYFFADDKFTSDDGVTGYYDRELFRSDGTEAGTYRVKDINPGPVGSTGGNLATFNNNIYFTADDGTSVNLWKSNGTDAGTVKVSAHGGTFSNTPVAAGNNLFYIAAPESVGNELYKTDGTTAGLVKDINPTGDSVPLSFLPVGDKLYFSADDGTHGRELWVTDGTEAGTVMVKDVVPGDASGGPDELTAAGGAIFFTAIVNNPDFSVKTSLWKTDGTEAGTVKLFEEPGVSFGYAITNLTVFGNQLLFKAPGAVDGDGFSIDVELYSIAVPEPSLLSVAAAAGLLVRRRNRS